jgi:translocation and assembly module TamB
MTVKDVTITTEGRVGIDDQSLHLLANVPIQESWLAKAPPYLAGLKGKTLQIPITGTIGQPKLDARVLENLTKQLAAGAVKGAVDQQLQKGQTILQDELGKGLNRLFGPLQPKPPSPALPMP